MRGWTIALDVNNFKVFSSENKCLVFAILILADSHVEFCCHSVSCMISQKKNLLYFYGKKLSFILKVCSSLVYLQVFWQKKLYNFFKTNFRNDPMELVKSLKG